MQKKRALFLILVIAFFLRIISLNQSFWLDEAIQAVISLKPIFAVNYTGDFQPPLFYILIHVWMTLGNKAEWFLRLPSVFFGVATVYVLYIFVKKLFNEKSAILAALLLATAPYHIYFSQEFRMYSFFTLLVLFSWYFLYEKKWAWYSLVITAAIFTHYFGFIVIISQLVYVLLVERKSIRLFLTSLILPFVLFCFWLPTFIKQLQTASSLVSLWPRWKEVSSVSFLKFPFLFLAKTTVGMVSIDNKMVYAGVVGIVGIIFVLSIKYLVLSMKSRKSQHTRYLILDTRYYLLFCYFLIPLVVAWISGLFIAANSPHRLTFVLPAFYAMIAVGLVILTTEQNKSVQNLDPGQAMMTLVVVVVLLSNIFFSSLYLLNPKYHRENWRGAVAYTDSRAEERGIILSEFTDPFAPMLWYSKKPDKYIGASTSIEITNKSIKQRLNPYILNTKNFILYTYLFEISDPQRLVEYYLQQHDYKLIEEKDFRGVGIIKTFSKR